MFAGIVKEIGYIEKIERKCAHSGILVNAASIAKETDTGDSISVDGACLTVVDKTNGSLRFDVIGETLANTTLGHVREKDKVNLEPSLKIKGAVSGHIVTGHIDEIATIKSLKRLTGDMIELTIGIDRRNLSMLVSKGSVAVNGVSLTVNRISVGSFVVNIIPHTFKTTTMHTKRAGDLVNVEFDIIGKYVLKHLEPLRHKGVGWDFLKEHGFTV